MRSKVLVRIDRLLVKLDCRRRKRKIASKTRQKRTNILYLTAEILYPKAENTNVQMQLKPLWFGLFLILIET